MDDEPNRLSNRLFEYDSNTNSWTELGPMRYSKYRCSTVVFHEEIYVMGEYANGLLEIVLVVKKINLCICRNYINS